MIVFEIPTEPVAKQRPRVTKFGTYTPEKTSKFEEAVGLYAKSIMRGRLPLEGALAVQVRFLCARPGRPTNEWPKQDIDNLLKSILDALNKIAWKDDSQIVELHATKRYSTTGSIQIRVFQAD
jgi:Holliday junction resolvase RusA-like endonuclease